MLAWGTFGFNYVGLLFWLAIQIPNIMWARHKPFGYDPIGENRVFLVLERMGQVICTASILILTNTIPTGWNAWLSWFICAVALMLVYEAYWVRYFRGDRSLDTFYRRFLGVPLPGATLPVVAFLFLGIYGRLLPLIIGTIILGIGHIGIHQQHFAKLNRTANGAWK